MVGAIATNITGKLTNVFDRFNISMQQRCQDGYGILSPVLHDVTQTTTTHFVHLTSGIKPLLSLSHPTGPTAHLQPW